MFTIDQNRVTVIVGSVEVVEPAPSVVHVDSVRAIQQATATADVERIILDRSTSAEEFLHLLAILAQIAGDVMLIRDDGGAFLSATARGGDRVLYALSACDVDFYLQTHGLISEERRFAWTA